MPLFLRKLNVVAECRSAHLGLWSCPPFLFVVMGTINVAAMVASWLLAVRYVAEPQVAALVVIAVAVAVFIVGNLIIHGFNQVAEANRMKSEFIAIVSHQLRSPLSIFKWTLDAMMRSQSATSSASPAPSHPPGGTGAGRSSYLEILREHTDKMIQLVNMLLEVSRIEAGRLVIRYEPVRLDILTEEIIRSVAPYARAAEIGLNYVASAALPPVRGDREKIKMVISNLVDNAVRYSRPGGRVVVSSAPRDSAFVEWRVKDDGVGIPVEEQRFVFQKFFRSPNAVRHETQGSGLGLYIARSLVTALGGDIGFASSDGRGTTFWFRLPIYSA